MMMRCKLFFALLAFIIFTQTAAALEFYKNESDDASLVTAGSALDKVNLTFTAQGGDYIVIASFNLQGDAQNNRGIVNVSVDGMNISVYDWSVIDGTNVPPVNNETFLAVNKTTLSAGTHTILTRLNAIDGITISNARISVLSFGSEDKYNNSEAMTLLPASFTEIVNLTFTPTTSGNYLFLATAEVNSSTNAESVLTRFKVDNDKLADQSVRVNLATDFKSFAASRVLFLNAASHNATIEAMSGVTDNNQGIARARILAIRLTDFYPFATNSSTALSTDDIADGSFREKVTLTFTPSFEADTLIFVTADTQVSDNFNGDENIEALLNIDGIERSRHVYVPVDVTDFVSFGQYKNLNLNATSHNLQLLFREVTATGSIANIQNASITIIIPDTFSPNVTSNTNNVLVNNGSTVTLNATITDLGSGVKNASVNVSAINATLTQVSLINQSSGNFWNVSIIADRTTTGFANLTITAYDNTSNVNNSINMTVKVNSSIETSVTANINATGYVNATLNIPTPDANITVTLPNGTTATLSDGVTPISTITTDSVASVNSTLETSASNSNLKFLGKNLTLLPEGAQFNPYMLVGFNYSDADIPSGVSEDDLKTYFYNSTTGAWEALTTHEHNKSGNYLIARVPHLSTFALLGTVTSTPTTSTGSSGSTGGSGVVSSEPYTNIEKAERYDRNLIANTSVAYIFKEPEHAIYEIAVINSISENDVALRYEALKGTSKLVTASPPGVVYLNENVWLGTKRIKEAAIKFRVTNSWLNENNLAGSEVKMVKWDGSKWVQLETAEKTKDATFTYYEAKTDTFSQFAITGLKGEIVPTATPAIEVTETPAITATPAIAPTEKAAGFELVLAIVSFLAVYLFVRKRI